LGQEVFGYTIEDVVAATGQEVADTDRDRSARTGRPFAEFHYGIPCADWFLDHGPVALAARVWPHLFEGLPEAERAISSRRRPEKRARQVVKGAAMLPKGFFCVARRPARADYETSLIRFLADGYLGSGGADF
jgi:hypothetical protein